jgi:hypothetical protein
MIASGFDHRHSAVAAARSNDAAVGSNQYVG